MSRDLTTDFKSAVTAGTVRPVFLITGEFDSGTIRFWNGVGTLTYGGNNYTGSGNLLKISEIVENQKIEARGASFELSGIPSTNIALALTEEYQGRTVTQTFAPLDVNGVPVADPFLIFSGEADVMSIEEGRNSASLRLTAESDLIGLTRLNERRHTPEDQKLTYSGDTFFDQVASLQSKDLVWGRNK